MENIQVMDRNATVYCKQCKRPVLPQNVDWAKNTAFCDGCNHSFPFEKSPERRREEIVMPKGVKNIRLTLARNELTVVVRWVKNYPLRRALVVKEQKQAKNYETNPGPPPLLAPGGFNAPVSEYEYTNMDWSWGFLTQLMAYFLNRTRVRVTAEYIWIEHKPMDVLPTVFFHARQIEQLFVREVCATAYLGFPTRCPTLFLKLKNGEEFDILWDLRLDLLLYLEQEIERILGIEDREMPEEIV